MVNALKVRGEANSRSLFVAFMSRATTPAAAASAASENIYTQNIYTITSDEIRRRDQFDDDLHAIISLSAMLALLLTMFMFWLVYSLRDFYNKTKLESAITIAREIAYRKHRIRIMNDPVVDVKLTEVAFKISRDLNFFSYLQL